MSSTEIKDKKQLQEARKNIEQVWLNKYQKFFFVIFLFILANGKI
jgi:hypothetical protein